MNEPLMHLTDERHPEHPNLRRLVFARDCGFWEAGDKGGWAQHEDNVTSDAMVTGDAAVTGNARVGGTAMVEPHPTNEPIRRHLMNTDANTLRDLPLTAANHIDTHGWTQGVMEDDNGAVCLTGALHACSPQPGDWFIATAVVQEKGHAESWNDEPSRTAEEVTDWLRANPITDADLEATFGPQWRQIVNLLRRVAVLTKKEARALDATWPTAQNVAFDAAERAAEHTARNAVLGEAFDAALDATWPPRTERRTVRHMGPRGR